ncbi:cuticle protein [Holotrichia oblita]|uniref:Cuticle protein n=1 Tax=Holotrichia oblita TaxID=644536 RepID=A0ACB9T4N9_HOLOL|nr:cuticle protein [Holotrichia oblita]
MATIGQAWETESGREILVLTVIGVVFSQFTGSKPYVRILRQRQEIDPIGSYNWQFETENGIASNEQGRLRPISGQRGSEEALRAEGEFKYTSPEGVPVYVNYVADEDGYQPQSDLIPTPPPIPEYIIRSLEWQRNHPQQPTRKF